MGYQIAPENCAKYASTSPNSRMAGMESGWASFWLSCTVSPSSSDSAESPMGPSPGPLSAVIMMRRPSRSTGTEFRVRRKRLNPSARSSLSSSSVTKPGSSTVMSLRTFWRRFSGSKWSLCRWET